VKATCVSSETIASPCRSAQPESLAAHVVRSAGGLGTAILRSVQASDLNPGQLERQVAEDVRDLSRHTVEPGAQAKADATPPQCPFCRHSLNRLSRDEPRAFKSRYGESLLRRTRGYCKTCLRLRVPIDAASGMGTTAAIRRRCRTPPSCSPARCRWRRRTRCWSTRAGSPGPHSIGWPAVKASATDGAQPAHCGAGVGSPSAGTGSAPRPGFDSTTAGTHRGWTTRAARRTGEPIGSGLVEATCRRCQDRFTRPGRFGAVDGMRPGSAFRPSGATAAGTSCSTTPRSSPRKIELRGSRTFRAGALDSTPDLTSLPGSVPQGAPLSHETSVSTVENPSCASAWVSCPHGHQERSRHHQQPPPGGPQPPHSGLNRPAAWLMRRASAGPGNGVCAGPASLHGCVRKDPAKLPAA
jgi:hypothetical protein